MTLKSVSKIKQFVNSLVSDRGLLILALLLILLNLLDAGLSWYFIYYVGVAVEANPIMAIMMEQGIIWFFLYKIIVVPSLVLFLYKVRNLILSKISIVFGCFCFLVVITYTLLTFFGL